MIQNNLLSSAKSFLQNRTTSTVSEEPKKIGFIESAKNYLRNIFTPKDKTPILRKPEKEIAERIADKISGVPILKETLINVARLTSGTGIKAAIKASSPNITFNEAYESLRKSQAEKDDTFQEKFLTQLKDTAPQTAIGVALNFVPFIGTPLAVGYWSAISSGAELEEKGKIVPTNVAIDVIGDRMLGSSLESLFKKPAKTLWSTIRKTFGVEGGTEVAQDLLKFGNDYRLSKNEKEKEQILTRAKEYFTSGQILITAGVGGTLGAGIGAGGYAIQQTPQVMEREAQELSKQKGISIEKARKEISQRGSVKLPEQDPLIQEAKKYKSADEFVKAQPTVYHGSNKKIDSFDKNKLGLASGEAGYFGDGFYFTSDKNNASRFAKQSTQRSGGKETINEVFLDYKKPFVIDEKTDIKLIEKLSGNKKFIDGATKADTSATLIGGKSNFTDNIKKQGYDAVIVNYGFNRANEIVVFNQSQIKTKSQLIDIWNKAQGKTTKEMPTNAPETMPITAPESMPVKDENLLPAVIRGETFTLGEQRFIQPSIKELKAKHKLEIKAREKEIKNAEIARKKAEKLEEKNQKIRLETIENVNKYRGDTERIVKALEEKYLSKEDIENIILENGVRLVDTVRIKRNADKTLASVITKEQIERAKQNYTGEKPSEKWTKKGTIKDIADSISNLVGKYYEAPQVFFEAKGLSEIYDKNIEGQRGAEVQKQVLLKKFKDAGLYKRGGIFTADRFNISKQEAENIAKYYLARQKRGYKTKLGDLSNKEKDFVKVFDSIIEETEPRFFEVAKKVGKNPTKVENYAPIMTSDDIRLADEQGTMEWLFRKHPAFFSLKERVKGKPNVYELDYRKVVNRWIDGITKFSNTSETTQDLKYLIESDSFKSIVSGKDYNFISNWLQDITTPKPVSPVDKVGMFFRRTTAVASLGLNYASVVKQALTQVPLIIIEKAPPKLKSEYAKAFGIKVSELPSITKRSGDVAITDLQGKLGRIFTGALTEFDRANAQLSLNALLDKEYSKYKNQGVEISPEIRKQIEKTAQDKLDLWYAGFFNGQRPEAFRSQIGNFLNMFIYPLTSQLNGFYRQVLRAKGVKENLISVAEVMTAATIIAYLEQAITKLAFQWDDEEEMTKDILVSLSGNIPIVSQIVYSFATDQQLQVSAGISGIESLRRNISGYLKEEKDIIDLAFSTTEMLGLPKQFRRIHEAIEIIQEQGITDKDGKMLAPIKDELEIVRSFLRGKYGSLASQDWVNNIGEKKENRRWFVPEVEFLQNGDYERKAELYIDFNKEDREFLMKFLSDNQKKKLKKGITDFINKDKTIDKIKQKIMERGIRDEKKINDIAEKVYKDIKQ